MCMRRDNAGHEDGGRLNKLCMRSWGGQNICTEKSNKKNSTLLGMPLKM